MPDDPIVPLGDGGMDREFQAFDQEVPSTAYQQDAIACGGLSVAAAHLEVAGTERAALIFHFQQADGTPFPQALVLVTEDAQMEMLARVVGQGAQRAVAAARRARRGK
jgi:hypothetical protein